MTLDHAAKTVDSPRAGCDPEYRMRTDLVVMMALGLGLATAGCGNNECEDAVDKIDECGFDAGESKPDDDEANECNEKDECNAKCTNEGSCADIQAAVMGTQNSVHKCWAACPVK